MLAVRTVPHIGLKGAGELRVAIRAEIGSESLVGRFLHQWPIGALLNRVKVLSVAHVPSH